MDERSLIRPASVSLDAVQPALRLSLHDADVSFWPERCHWSKTAINVSRAKLHNVSLSHEHYERKSSKITPGAVRQTPC